MRCLFIPGAFWNASACQLSAVWIPSLMDFFGYVYFSVTFADIAKQVLDRCVVSNPDTLDPNNKDFEVVFDYSFVEDHARWLIHLLNLH